MRGLDTDAAAGEVQLELYRRMTPEARVMLAARMSDDARSIARAGIADRHPEYSLDEVELALRRLILGDDLFQRAWPTAPLLAP